MDRIAQPGKIRMKRNRPISTDGEVARDGPLYRRLAQELKRSITSGVHPVGTMLPTEQELCERFNTSRYTVREALRLLGEGGMVDRRQGRGSEVISSRERPVYAQSLTSLTQLYDYANDTRLVIDRVLRIVPDDQLAIRLGRLPGREWLLAEGIRTTSDDNPICVSHVFIHQDFASVGPELVSHAGAIHRLIEDRFDIQVHEVHQQITTEKLDAGMAARLGELAGCDAVLVTRRYLASDSRPILISLNWHRLAGFAYSQVIRRE